MDEATTLSRWSPAALAILRLMTGLLFLEHGTAKILGFPQQPNPGPALLSLMGAQGLIELIGGALIALGLFTRPLAFILCGDMAVAYFMSHAPNGFFPLLNRGEGAILYCFIFLAFIAVGGGPYSLDGLRRRG